MLHSSIYVDQVSDIEEGETFSFIIDLGQGVSFDGSFEGEFLRGTGGTGPIVDFLWGECVYLGAIEGEPPNFFFTVFIARLDPTSLTCFFDEQITKDTQAAV
jgi:hypothetical protein